MHAVPVAVVSEVLSVPMAHFQYLTQRDTPEWFALHRKLVQRLRSEGIETLINPLSGDIATDEQISHRVFHGDIRMRRIVRVSKTSNRVDTLRGTAFRKDGEMLMIGSHMSRPLSTDERMMAKAPDDVAIFLAATTSSAAQTIGIALARSLIRSA